MCEKGLETIGASKNGTRFLKIEFLILIRAMEEKQKRKLEKVRKAALLVSNARVYVHIYIFLFTVCTCLASNVAAFSTTRSDQRGYIPPSRRFLLSGISFVPRRNSRTKAFCRQRERERENGNEKKERKAPATYKSPEVPKII